jgi:hypothetical protein
MSTLRTRPHIDSLHTLNVWTPYGNLMAKWHEIMNGERRPFVNSGVRTMDRDDQPSFHGTDNLLDSLRSNGKITLPFIINDRRCNYLVLKAAVTFAAPVAESETAWILGLEGALERHAHDRETEEERSKTSVKIACFYDTGNGRGFCMLPELARQQIWCS